MAAATVAIMSNNSDNINISAEQRTSMTTSDCVESSNNLKPTSIDAASSSSTSPALALSNDVSVTDAASTIASASALASAAVTVSSTSSAVVVPVSLASQNAASVSSDNSVKELAQSVAELAVAAPAPAAATVSSPAAASSTTPVPAVAATSTDLLNGGYKRGGAENDPLTGYYDEVEIEDMEYDAEKEEYIYPCPCGDKFRITKEELLDGEDIARCASCSLLIKVIYDPDDLEEED